MLFSKRKTERQKQFEIKRGLIERSAFEEERLKMARQAGLRRAREGSGIGRGIKKVSTLNFGAATKHLSAITEVKGNNIFDMPRNPFDMQTTTSQPKKRKIVKKRR